MLTKEQREQIRQNNNIGTPPFERSEWLDLCLDDLDTQEVDIKRLKAQAGEPESLVGYQSLTLDAWKKDRDLSGDVDELLYACWHMGSRVGAEQVAPIRVGMILNLRIERLKAQNVALGEGVDELEKMYREKIRTTDEIEALALRLKPEMDAKDARITELQNQLDSQDTVMGDKDERIEALEAEVGHVSEAAILWAGLSAVEREQAIQFNMRNAG